MPTLSCTITGLDNGTTYDVTVTGTNAIGTGPAATANGSTRDAESFVIVVDTTKGTFGTGANERTVALPLRGAANVTIDWGGAHQTCPTTLAATLTANVECTYDAPGTYEGAFSNATNFIGVPTDLPPPSRTSARRSKSRPRSTIPTSPPGTSPTSSRRSIWRRRSTRTSAAGTSRAASTSAMFQQASAFNRSLSDWDFSSATNLKSLLQSAWAFNNGCASGVRDDTNCALDFDASKVTTMVSLFSNAKAFNQKVDHWDTSSLTSLHGAFNEADAFNQSLTNWDVSKVTLLSSTFFGADVFNDGCDPGIRTCPLAWNTASATTLDSTFCGAKAFDQDLDGTTSNETTLDLTFRNTAAFNGDITDWDTSNVTTLESTFSLAVTFDQPIGAWDVSKVTTMANAFNSASAFAQDVSGWCVSGIAREPNNFRLGNTPPGFISPVWGTCP